MMWPVLSWRDAKQFITNSIELLEYSVFFQAVVVFYTNDSLYISLFLIKTYVNYLATIKILFLQFVIIRISRVKDMDKQCFVSFKMIYLITGKYVHP